jgi:cytochrome c-type biogenesis protein CcmH/NrfG
VRCFKINWGVLVFLGLFVLTRMVSAQPAAPAYEDSILLTVEGKVEAAAAGTTAWLPAQTNQVLHVGDRLRTGLRSRATVRLSNLTVLRVNELTTLQIQPPSALGKQAGLDLQKGAAYFFSRERPTETEFRTPLASGAIRGTEFNLAVADDGSSVVTLIDGEVALNNPQGEVNLVSGEQGTVEPGKAPTKTASINALNIIQWSLYYPAVLNLDELNLADAEKQTLAASLAAYRAGDLLAAMASYPTNRTAVTDAEKIYLAQLLLAVGQVDQSATQLVSVQSPLAEALREVVAAVKFQPLLSTNNYQLSTTLLADSYYQQSRSQLEAALKAARTATEKSPAFGFAWELLAELEFSFGHTDAALAALAKGLELSPHNAEAISLKGFLLAAQNKSSEAKKYFDEAIATDGALGNAWLGRGLVKIHQGDATNGLRDLQVAAVLEPNRSVLRSYLGKAFANENDSVRAERELKLAQKLDPNDPTAWLYLALLEQQENKINDAISDLEKSKELNDNRRVFRSKLLLDQDQAVRSANLAKIYQDAGMTDVSVNEASRAVTSDYANSSAHLFLSDAFNELRDPTQFNLRYETVWFNEFLLANALAPVGGGRLSQGVSQQEYSKLFAADGLGFSSSTDYRTDKKFHEQISQYGIFGNTAYALDLNYHHNDGIRPNNSLDDIEWNTTIKQQVTAKDTATLLVQYQNYHSGDNFQYYNQANARPNYKFDEYQEPILVGIWHHEWSPGQHTLVLASRLVDEQHFSDQQAKQLLLDKSTPNVVSALFLPYDVDYHNQFEIYSAELNQIGEWDRITISAGARYQAGSFQTQNQFKIFSLFAFGFPTILTPNSANENFQRTTGYGYLTVEPLEKLWLTAGLAYDQVKFPDNYRAPPVTPGEAKRSQLGPKVAVVWSPVPQATLRGFYARSLGGVSLDESYRLEPTQLGGFPQAFRSLISESAVGSVSAPKYDTLGLAFDFKISPKTYGTIQAERFITDVQRDIGDFEYKNIGGGIDARPNSTPETLNYKEYNLSVSLNQLVGDQLVVGTSYKLIQANLHDTLSAIPTAVLATADQREHSTLHQITGYVLWNHPSGFFARADAEWFEQFNSGYATPLPGDSFFQENIYVGYRFFHRRAELLLGLLNLAGQNYQLNPLTVYSELPRSRVFEVKFGFIF